MQTYGYPSIYIRSIGAVLLLVASLWPVCPSHLVLICSEVVLPVLLWRGLLLVAPPSPLLGALRSMPLEAGVIQVWLC